MIVRTHARSFGCLTQHHHAQVAGQLAAHWPLHQFPDSARRDEVLLAVREHDRGWIPLDGAPCWNEQRQAPFSFLDYPLMPRLRHYQRGIDEVAALSPYAGLLCSLHYSSLSHLAAYGAGQAFLRQEARRQRRLRQQLGLTTAATAADLRFYLHLLQFCDGLSLYLCLRDPDATQADDCSAARFCTPAPAPGSPATVPHLGAVWTGWQALHLPYSPFEQPFRVALQYVELAEDVIQTQGLAACYEQAPVREQVVQIG